MADSVHAWLSLRTHSTTGTTVVRISVRISTDTIALDLAWRARRLLAETSRTDFSLFTHIAAPPAVCRIIEDILTHSITALPVRWAHNIACPASVVACLDMGADAVAAGIILRTHNTAISAVAGIGGRINTGPVAFQVRGQADEETRATDTVGGLWRALSIRTGVRQGVS